MSLQPEQTFRPNRLWRLPFLGLHDYVLPQTIDDWFGGMEAVAGGLASSPVELVVVATDVTGDDASESAGFELVYSSRTTPPDILGDAILASAAVSALVLPLRVGDRIATDGAWVRNFPLGHAYDHDSIELIVAFRLPAPVSAARRRGARAAEAAAAPVRPCAARARVPRRDRACRAASRAWRAGSPRRHARPAGAGRRPAQHGAEERLAVEKDTSLRELHALRHDVLGLVADDAEREAIDARFGCGALPVPPRPVHPAHHRCRRRRRPRARPRPAHAAALVGRAEAPADQERLGGGRPRARCDRGRRRGLRLH